MNPLKIGDLSIPVPIVQGGMGVGISLANLASAVANAGGIGTIATVGLGLIYNFPDKTYRENNRNALKSVIRKARRLTDGILGVNIMSVLTNFDELVKTAINEKIDIIFSGAGLPLDLPKYLKPSSKTKLVPIVSSGRAANIIAQKWKNNYGYLPDAFVVEGPKAGGHLGFNKQTLENPNIQLKDLVRDTLMVTTEIRHKYNKKIPIIAGGGITSGKDIFDILQSGASAVQVGSRFIATKECDASDKFKQAIIQSKKNNIRIIESPVGMPGRAIGNIFLESAENGERRPQNCKYHCIKSCNPKTTSYCIAEALLSAYHGNLESGFVFCGANAYKINSLTTVPELFRELISGYHAEKQNYQKKYASIKN